MRSQTVAAAREPHDKATCSSDSVPDLDMDEFEMFRRQSLHGGRTEPSPTPTYTPDSGRRFTVHEADRRVAPRLSLAVRRSVDRLSPFHHAEASTCVYSHANALYEAAPVQFDDVKICHLSAVLKNSWCAATASASSSACNANAKPVLKATCKKQGGSRSVRVQKTVAFDFDLHAARQPFVPATYYVQLLGSPGVGKSTLCSQFVGANCDGDDPEQDDELLDDCDPDPDQFCRPKRVSVVLDGEESSLIFLHTLAQTELERVSVVSGVHAYLVVYAIDDLASFHFAHATLEAILVSNDIKTTAILVANKSDLARCKEVRTDDGKLLAERFSCVFVETSATLQHHVDDLLVEVLRQIRLSIARQAQFALHSASSDNASANANELTPLTGSADFLDGPAPKHAHAHTHAGLFYSILRRISKHK